MSELRVKKGVRFRNVIGEDCNALWEVRSSRGAKCWVCFVVDEPWECNGKTYDSDFAGQTEVFAEEKILRILLQEQAWTASNKKHDDFFAGLRVGQIVHYDNGFNQYVRCIVVLGKQQVAETHPLGSRLVPMLKGLALVGPGWRDADLPRRWPDGSVSVPFHAQKIKDGEIWRCHASCIVENPDWQRQTKGKPGKMPAEEIAALRPLGLEVTEPTAEEKQIAEVLAEKARIMERLELVKNRADMSVFKSWLASYPCR